MATSGVSTFDPEFDDILQDAVAMVGGGPILADELQAGQRGINYLMASIQNKNILLHKIETTVVPASVSVSSVALPADIVDVLTATVRVSTTEIPLSRDGFQRWAEIPVKSQTGRPIRYWFDRRRGDSNFHVWPLPNVNYDLVITVHKTAEDMVRAFHNVDVPRRFLPAIVYGLAYWIGLRRNKRVPLDRLMFLKQMFESELRDAMREDRERGPFILRIGRT